MSKQGRLEQVIQEAIEPYLVCAVRSGFKVAILEALAKEGVVLKVEIGGGYADIEPLVGEE